MGKHGPCCHCGVTSTPLWRNGPPEKPILCNACGSRWRTKGSLVNYTPLHARGELNEYQDYKIPRSKIMAIKPKELKALKRKQNHENKAFSKNSPDYNKFGFLKTVDEETSNWSSSGSALSNVSESCMPYGSVDVTDFTGPVQSAAWDQTVPSKKRTCLNRPKQSQVEKLTKDLYTILHEQQSSHFSNSSEEDLLFESDQPMVSVEIGHGSVLIRHPSFISQDEESEASSISVENKALFVNDFCSRSPTFPLLVNKVGTQQEQVNNRDKDEHEKPLILENHNSPLCHIDLKEIINYQVFSSHMTNVEQQQLLQLLPEIDTATPPHSLQSMFTNPGFEEDLMCLQKLLSEGVFDFSVSGVKAEDCETLKRLVLSASDKSYWVEQYSLLKSKEAHNIDKGSISRGAKLLAYDSSINGKRSRDGYLRVGSGTKTTTKSPNFKDLIENGGSVFSTRNLFPMVEYVGENSEQDLLLDVPRNSSFLEAELFYQNSPSSSSIYPLLTDPSKAF